MHNFESLVLTKIGFLNMVKIIFEQKEGKKFMKIKIALQHWTKLHLIFYQLGKGMSRIGALYLTEMTKTSASKFLHKVCDMAENFVGCKSNIGPPKMSFEMDLGIMAKSLEPWHIDLPLGLNNSHGNKAKLKPFVHGPPLNFIIKLK